MSADRALLTIDLDAVAANLAALRHIAGSAEVAPVVKADGYGLGVGPLTRRLHAEGARAFHVARVGEAEALRGALGPRDADILVLDGCPGGCAPRMAAARLTPVLNTIDQVAEWRRAEGGEAWLHVDTGMNRLGLTVDEAQALAQSPDRLRGVEVVGVMSHLACATTPGDARSATQRARYREVAALFPNARRSLCATAGMFLGADYLFDHVRPGIGLLGGGPFDAPDARIGSVVTLEAPVLQLRILRAGESVGYGAGFTATETRRIAIVAAGYADGFLRAGAPGAYGMLDGRRLPVLGRISMDLTAFDASDCDAARPGAPVTLIGPDLPVDVVASNAGTIAHDVLTGLGARAERRWLGGEG